VECSTRLDIRTGIFTYINNAAGSLGYLSCNLPYVLKGYANYQCTIEGNWEGNGMCSKFFTFSKECTYLLGYNFSSLVCR